MNRHLHMLLNCHETWKVEPLLNVDRGGR